MGTNSDGQTTNGSDGKSGNALPRARRIGRRLRRWVLYPVLAVFVVLVLLVGGVMIWLEATMFRGDDEPTGPMALTDATVLVGEDLTPQEGWTVVVSDGRVADLGPEGDVEIPDDAERIAMPGRTILPGLVDSHVHLGAPSGGGLAIVRAVFDAMRYAAPAREALLEHGVTTMRSLGDDTQWITEIREFAADGDLAGPRVFAAGPVFTTAGGHPVATIGLGTGDPSVRVPGSPDEARSMVRELAEGDPGPGGAGPVDLIKVVHDRGEPGSPDRALDPLPVPVLEAIVDEAHDAGLPVSAHWGSPEDLEEVLDAGVDDLQHIEPRGVPDGWDGDLLERLVADDIPVAPTTAVIEPVVDPEPLERVRAAVSEFADAGGTLLAASDAPMNGIEFGDALIREIELLVEAGVPTQDALVAATAAPGALMPLDGLGVLDVGHPADLLVVDGDPLADITALRHVEMVVQDGRTVVGGED